MDEDERAALLRIRTLRRDAYRCQHRQHDHAPICGTFASAVGSDPVVALCRAHAPVRSLS